MIFYWIIKTSFFLNAPFLLILHTFKNVILALKVSLPPSCHTTDATNLWLQCRWYQFELLYEVDIF